MSVFVTFPSLCLLQEVSFAQADVNDGFVSSAARGQATLSKGVEFTEA